MIHAGYASAIVTPPIGAAIQAAGHNKRATHIRDECEANGVLISAGRETVIVVSLDLVGLELQQANRMRDAVGRGAGIARSNIAVACTHTHSGPSLMKTHPDKEIDFAYLDSLESRLEQLGRDLAASVGPARIGWGLGETQIGYNRRVCWADGTHTMHGDVTTGGFRGLEGPDDPSHLVISVTDLEGHPVAIVHNNTSHPTTFYGADFFSADFPGEARSTIRRTYGEQVAVLYLNGAQGDIAIEDQLTKSHTRRSSETLMERTSQQVSGETIRLFTETILHDEIDVAATTAKLTLPIALPSEDRLEWARGVLDTHAEGASSTMDQILAFGISSLNDNFSSTGSQDVVLQAIRIGQAALCFVPFELYCQFGLDIKHRSPASHTGVVGLANGSEGYVPTPYAALGGGYSGEPIRWTRFDHTAGFRVVEQSVDLLYRLWESSDR